VAGEVGTGSVAISSLLLGRAVESTTVAEQCSPILSTLLFPTSYPLT
jgi:hypothetical protein